MGGMTIHIHTTAEAEVLVGTPLFLEGEAPSGKYGAVFEDDGGTGYFYAIVPSDQEQPIQDALHIYNARDVADATIPSQVKIGWSNDGEAVLLAINGNVHAVFNFGTRQGCCRTGFPPPNDRGWGSEGHAWRDNMLEAFAT